MTDEKRTMSKGRRLYLLILLLVTGVVIGMLIVTAGAAEAQPVEPLDVELPITTIIRDTPGSVHPIGTVPAIAGAECIATLRYTNQGPDFSEHDTDILVGPIEFLDVERGPGQVYTPMPFTATGPVAVSIRINDGLTSGGFLVGVTCNPPTTTTPVPPSPSTTVSVPTTTPSMSQAPVVTTITVPVPRGVDTGRGAPIGGVAAGGGPLANDWGWGELLIGGGVWLLLAGLVWAVVRAMHDIKRPDNERDPWR